MKNVTLFIMIACIFLTLGCQKESLGDLFSDPAADAIELRNSQVFPELIPLPLGNQPEGITAGSGATSYVGSLTTGGVFQVDLRTGKVDLLVDPESFSSDRLAVGMDYDPRSQLLFVAGGSFGTAYAYDTRTGEEVAAYDFGGAFVNDVIVTGDAAYFTDSFTPLLYKVPLGSAGAPENSFEVLTLGGDFEFVPGTFNTNGIDATPNGKALIIVNSANGNLYRVDPGSGEASLIDLGGDNVTSGDGILLDGKTLYVVRNFLNEIAVVELNPKLTSGTLLPDAITSSYFRIPTTVDEFGSSLYAVNARFDLVSPGQPTGDLRFEVVRVSK